MSTTVFISATVIKLFNSSGSSSVLCGGDDIYFWPNRMCQHRLQSMHGGKKLGVDEMHNTKRYI